MITPKRIAETMILVMICVPALLIAFYCVATRKPSGLIHVQAINGTATIKYDSHGVPTVSGTTDDAVFFGAGFAHAADRLWDMHLKRLFIAGRISEVPPLALTFGVDKGKGRGRRGHLHALAVDPARRPAVGSPASS